MPIEILMPALSPTMTEGNLAKWTVRQVCYRAEVV
jgi:pyruvate/2-oxoglutarate dehydrogenase complex dihydrolipoamide acyltransferase (E2) component